MVGVVLAVVAPAVPVPAVLCSGRSPVRRKEYDLGLATGATLRAHRRRLPGVGPAPGPADAGDGRPGGRDDRRPLCGAGGDKPGASK